MPPGACWLVQWLEGALSLEDFLLLLMQLLGSQLVLSNLPQLLLLLFFEVPQKFGTPGATTRGSQKFDTPGLSLPGGAGLVGLGHGRHTGGTRRCRCLLARLLLQLQPALEYGHILCQLMELLQPPVKQLALLVLAEALVGRRPRNVGHDRAHCLQGPTSSFDAS